jgi:arylsulfatase A-like enzyme
VGSSFGFAQGFDTYEDHDEEKEGGPGLLLRRALEWVRGRGDAPFFLFVHTYQPHIPYRSPAGDGGGRVPFPFTVVHAEESYAGRRILTEEERGEVRALYDADVRATDEAVGGFLQALRGDGVLDRAILVVFSDHGEDLWDRPASRAPGHGHALYQELLHVPLLVRAPGLVPAGGRLRSPVSLLDVAPTLLDLCRLPADPRHRGRSLGPVLRGGREFPPLPQVAEAVEYGPERFTLRDGALKVILADPRVLHHDVRLPFLPLEVYDLARDPAESDPRSGRSSPGLRRALALLQERQWRGEEGRPVERAGEMPADVREQLRSLGYVR